MNLRLDTQADADVIAWLESYGNGQRSTALRDVIRRGLGMVAPTEPAPDLEAIRQVIADELSRSLAALHFRKEIGQDRPATNEAEAKYGGKLDQMLGGLTRGTIDDPEES